MNTSTAKAQDSTVKMDTFGEQVYQNFVKNGQRSRFTYADVQILKGIESLEQLRA